MPKYDVSRVKVFPPSLSLFLSLLPTYPDLLIARSNFRMSLLVPLNCPLRLFHRPRPPLSSHFCAYARRPLFEAANGVKEALELK